MAEVSQQTSTADPRRGHREDDTTPSTPPDLATTGDNDRDLLLLGREEGGGGGGEVEDHQRRMEAEFEADFGVEFGGTECQSDPGSQQQDSTSGGASAEEMSSLTPSIGPLLPTLVTPYRCVLCRGRGSV